MCYFYVGRCASTWRISQFGEFSFSLRRLTEEQLASFAEKRSLDVGMTMQADGLFIVYVGVKLAFHEVTVENVNDED